MQKENLFFFSFPSESTLFLGTNKRAKRQEKTNNLLFLRAYLRHLPMQFASFDDTTLIK